jgi:hypothetical protein
MNQTQQIREALQNLIDKSPSAQCANFHHKKEHRHAFNEPCPALAEYKDAIKKAKQVLTKKINEEHGLQPIATAPKNEPILLYFPPCSKHHTREWYLVGYHPVGYPRKPTHWAPLPPTPAP